MLYRVEIGFRGNRTVEVEADELEEAMELASVEFENEDEREIVSGIDDLWVVDYDIVKG